MAPAHEVRGGAPGRVVVTPEAAAASGPPATSPAPGVGPLARAAELELQVREEAVRRERAEARAERAEALAEVAAGRAALLEARLAAAIEDRGAAERTRDALDDEVRRGLSGLARELDALRLLATSADDASSGPREDLRGARARTAMDPSARMGELARGARELLAGGRLEAADEVIRGLEDAAERLRAQAPPPAGQP